MPEKPNLPAKVAVALYRLKSLLNLDENEDCDHLKQEPDYNLPVSSRALRHVRPPGQCAFNLSDPRHVRPQCGFVEPLTSLESFLDVLEVKYSHTP